MEASSYGLIWSTRHLGGGAVKIMDHLSQVSQSLGRDLNLESLKYGAVLLTSRRRRPAADSGNNDNGVSVCECCLCPN
jgi:hypothetical protein